MRLIWSVAFCLLIHTELFASTLPQASPEYSLLNSHMISEAWHEKSLKQVDVSDVFQNLMDPLKATGILDPLEPTMRNDIPPVITATLLTLEFKNDFQALTRLLLDKPALLVKRRDEGTVYQVAAPPTIFALVAALAFPILHRSAYGTRRQWRYQRFSPKRTSVG